MSFLQRLFGGSDEPRQPQARGAQRTPMSEDERALARYRYMLQSAPPETLEQAHAEAFAQLTPEQRQMVLQGLAEDVPAGERAAYSDDPRSLARMATRAEMRQPGTLERRFGGMGGMGGGMGMGMPGMGSMLAGSFLSTIAGVMVGSAIADAFLGDAGYSDATGDAGGAEGGDAGAEGDAGGDFGGDAGGGGGDFGGFGDFGGGDFGGGDFGGEF